MDAINFLNPLYRFRKQDFPDELMVAQDLVGFFVEPSKDSSDGVTAFGVPGEFLALGGDIDDVELCVLDLRRDVIGSYFIGRVWFGDSIPSKFGVESADRNLSFYDYSLPYPKAGEIWRRWGSGVTLQFGEWQRYPVEYHSSWLHVVQTAWATSNRQSMRYGSNEICLIEGDQMLDEAGFFCALGEAVNDAGGYFGSNLDGLNDCLRQSAASVIPLRVQWNQYEVARAVLGAEFSDSVLALMRDCNVEIVLQ